MALTLAAWMHRGAWAPFLQPAGRTRIAADPRLRGLRPVGLASLAVGSIGALVAGGWQGWAVGAEAGLVMAGLPAPAGNRGGARSVALWAIPGALRKLADKAAVLRQQLAKLPAIDESLQLDAYGYHSGYLPAFGEVPEQPRWTLTLGFKPDAPITEVFLVPAADRRVVSMPGYGFPKRFRLIGIDEQERRSLIADWTRADYPDPGRMPARFTVEGSNPCRLVLEVFRGQWEQGMEFFALDEVLCSSRQVLWSMLSVDASSGFESQPFWSQAYVADRKSSLGLPVQSSPSTPVEPAALHQDCVMYFPDTHSGPWSVEMDLGANQKIGWIVFYPARHPDGIPVPGFGFPGSVGIEIFEELPAGGRSQAKFPVGPAEVISGGLHRMNNPGNNVVRIAGFGVTGRWLRFAFDDLPMHEGKSTFGLGEILISYKGTSLSLNAKIQADRPIEKEKGMLDRLVDGRAGGYPVMYVLDWLRALARRGQLAHDLRQNEATRAELDRRWRRFLTGSMATGGGIMVLGLAGATVAGIMVRRRQGSRLRRQITQDLHDDIGSKLGAISLAATYLQRISADRRVQERSRQIGAIARDMQVALGDVLWFTNTETDTLRELVGKLSDIARYTVPEAQLVLAATPLPAVPEASVGVQMKRDLMLIFKEALHNAVEHAQASRIEVAILWEKPRVILRVRDDGVGFDPAADLDRSQDRLHLGLRSMRERAQRIHASLRLESRPGAGTLVELAIVR
jgi:signal transduction histidine kinase